MTRIYSGLYAPKLPYPKVRRGYLLQGKSSVHTTVKPLLAGHLNNRISGWLNIFGKETKPRYFWEFWCWL